MNILRLEKLAIGQMASGHLNLDLSGKVSWNEFPKYASKLVKMCDGIVKNKSDAPDIRIWYIRINEVDLRLVFDDYPQMVSIESSSDAADEKIKLLNEMLDNYKRRYTNQP